MDIIGPIEFVFVFGSNLAGRHGKGAALYAKENWGAQYGVGVGRTGDAYAIPTKDEKLRTLPLIEIKKYVDDFLRYARDHPDIHFWVTPIGTGLAGYKIEDISPMFLDKPSNCAFTDSWYKND